MLQTEERSEEMRDKAVRFVTSVISDVYGQDADPNVVARTAERVLAAIPVFREPVVSKQGGR